MSPELLIALGRIIFGLFFVIAAVRNTRNFATHRKNKTNYGWTLPAPVLAAGFALQLIAGLALVIDVQTVWASIALIVFLCIATPLFHNPLMFKPEERGLHIYLDLVNIAFVGFLLQIIGHALGS